MRRAVFLDSSILLELLEVPGKSQQPAAIAAELKDRVAAGDTLLLPTAAIVETGNHIAQLAYRRRYADGLHKLLNATSRNAAPWA